MTEHSVARIEALFQEQRAGLERYFRARLVSAEEAKELAQEVYVRLIGLPKDRSVPDWEKLMWVTARNLATNRIKQRYARREANARLHIETEDYRTPESSFSEEQETTAVERAIDELPPRQRAVVARIREGQYLTQIAEALGVHERTCRRDLEVAILEIQQKIGLEQPK